MSQLSLAQALRLAGEQLRGGRLAEAQSVYQGILHEDSACAEALHGLGLIACQSGRVGEGVALLERAVRASPATAYLHNNLGLALAQGGQLERAEVCFRQALAIEPKFAEAQFNLGNALLQRRELYAAVECYRHCLALRGGDERYLGNLAAAQHHPEHPSSRLVGLHYDPAVTAEQIRVQHGAWAGRYAAPLAKEWGGHGHERSPERRLRIGYVSPYFCAHVVGRNFQPVLRHHDRGQFEIFCYCNVLTEDQITRDMASSADRWQRTLHLSDDELAQRIRADGIDILVELAQHLPGNRLLALARRPAPVQISHMGYPAGTGLDGIDYRISDSHLDSPESGEQAGGEDKVLRLKHSFWCYQGLAGAPEVGELPALRNGRITFGSLNNLAKISAPTMDLWRKVLDAVPGSRLALLVPPQLRANVLREFPARGIAPERLVLLPPLSPEQYMGHYGGIDIGLDTWPYNGHTTSLDAFWMGVPVLALAGHSAVSRAGESFLRHLGLPQLIASSPEMYVKACAELAGDVERLRMLRSTLRGRMQGSALMDAAGYTRDLEGLYRQAWRRWCAQA